MTDRAPTESAAIQATNDTPGRATWRTVDISWVCAHLTENTLYDGAALLREWDAMKAIALAAESTPALPVPGGTILTDAQISAGANVLCDCPKPKRIGRNAAIDVFHAMAPTSPLPAAPAPTEQAEITRLDIMGMIRAQCHRCYASAIDREEIDTKYMLEIEDALRVLAARQALIEAAKEKTWEPVTCAGQVKVGDKLRFKIGDTDYKQRAKQILNAGTDKEEVIYDKGRNFYFITSMVINGRSNHKGVEVLARPSPASSLAQGAGSVADDTEFLRQLHNKALEWASSISKVRTSQLWHELLAIVSARLARTAAPPADPICPQCKGSGEEPGAAGYPCPKCDGLGSIEAARTAAPSEPTKAEVNAERVTYLGARLTAMTQWLEANQSDVFQRGLWDAIHEADRVVPDPLAPAPKEGGAA